MKLEGESQSGKTTFFLLVTLSSLGRKHTSRGRSLQHPRQHTSTSAITGPSQEQQGRRGGAVRPPRDQQARTITKQRHIALIIALLSCSVPRGAHPSATPHWTDCIGRGDFTQAAQTVVMAGQECWRNDKG